MTQSAYTFEIVDDGPLPAALGGEWKGLYRAQASPHLSDSYDWASLSWAAVTSAQNRRPYCVVARRAGRAAAIWPLIVSLGGFVRVASPMNSEGSEYCPCLVHPDEPPDLLWTAVKAELQRRGDVDVLRLPHVRSGGAVAGLIGHLPCAHATIVQPAPMVRARDFPSTEDYTSWLPARLRANLRRCRRKLDQMGRVEFQDIVGADERMVALRWLLARKAQWLRQHKLSNPRLLSKSSADFMGATLNHHWSEGSRRIFALKLDGALIAVELVNVDDHRVEAFTTTYENALGKCSPGQLLTLEVIQWALARGLDYDFRPGRETYKLAWANHVAPVTSYLLPLTFRGGQFVRYRLARRWISARTLAPARALSSSFAARTGK